MLQVLDERNDDGPRRCMKCRAVQCHRKFNYDAEAKWSIIVHALRGSRNLVEYLLEQQVSEW